ncbi:FCD domain-containing protein [Rhodobacterales bacterium LSUCC0387]|nr:FCD domain-containing protein [Rhodobacterales bacterium LSUCC0387]
MSYKLSMAFKKKETPPGETAAQNVAALITAEIFDQFDLGLQLPSETELAARFKVSRVTVREALKLLAGRGLINLSRGRRAAIQQPDGAMFGAFLQALIHSDPRAVFDLTQVRRSLEVQSVTLACRNASRSGIDVVTSALAVMREIAQSMPEGEANVEVGQAFDHADVKFHQSIALAGGNRVLTFLFEAMEGALIESFKRSRRFQKRSRDTLLSVCDEHAQVLEHVQLKDERAAIEALLALIDRSEANLRSSSGMNVRSRM